MYYDMELINYLLDNLAYKMISPLFLISILLMGYASKHGSLMKGILAIVLFLISCTMVWIYNDGDIYSVIAILFALFGLLFFYSEGVSVRKLESTRHQSPNTSSKE